MSTTRRTALALTGAGLATVLSGVAKSTPVATTAAAPFADHSWTRARDLARQLADVLAEDDALGAGPGGDWYAEIYPSASSGHPVMFGSISSREWHRKNVGLPLTKLFDAHKLAFEQFTAACRETDRSAIGREPYKAAWRRRNKWNNAEDRALLDICRYRPSSAIDAKAKGGYLRTYMERNSLEPRHVAVILSNMFWGA